MVGLWKLLGLLASMALRPVLAAVTDKSLDHCVNFWDIAQLAERKTLNLEVAGSLPAVPAIPGEV